MIVSNLWLLQHTVPASFATKLLLFAKLPIRPFFRRKKEVCFFGMPFWWEIMGWTNPKLPPRERDLANAFVAVLVIKYEMLI